MSYLCQVSFFHEFKSWMFIIKRLLNNSIFNVILAQKPIRKVVGIVIQSVAMNPGPA